MDHLRGVRLRRVDHVEGVLRGRHERVSTRPPAVRLPPARAHDPEPRPLRLRRLDVSELRGAPTDRLTHRGTPERAPDQMLSHSIHHAHLLTFVNDLTTAHRPSVEHRPSAHDPQAATPLAPGDGAPHQETSARRHGRLTVSAARLRLRYRTDGFSLTRRRHDRVRAAGALAPLAAPRPRRS